MFEGLKVSLRAPRPEDAEPMIKILHDQKVMKNFSRDLPAPVSLSSLSQDLSTMWKNYSKEFFFSIEEKSSRRFIGSCGYNFIDRKNSFADIGIYIERNSWKKGYGNESLRLLIGVLFSQHNLNKIRLSVNSNNESALRCYERLGFKHEGRAREELFQDGRYHDVCHMGLLKKEWSSSSHSDELGIHDRPLS